MPFLRPMVIVLKRNENLKIDSMTNKQLDKLEIINKIVNSRDNTIINMDKLEFIKMILEM